MFLDAERVPKGTVLILDWSHPSSHWSSPAGLQDIIHGTLVDRTSTKCSAHPPVLGGPQRNFVTIKGSTLRQPLDNQVVMAMENLEEGFEYSGGMIVFKRVS